MGGAPPLMGLGLIPLTAGSALIGSRDAQLGFVCSVSFDKNGGLEIIEINALKGDLLDARQPSCPQS